MLAEEKWIFAPDLEIFLEVISPHSSALLRFIASSHVSKYLSKETGNQVNCYFWSTYSNEGCCMLFTPEIESIF